MYGWACTKFVVPSIGSTTNVGAGVNRPDLAVSSPRKLRHTNQLAIPTMTRAGRYTDSQDMLILARMK